MNWYIAFNLSLSAAAISFAVIYALRLWKEVRLLNATLTSCTSTEKNDLEVLRLLHPSLKLWCLRPMIIDLRSIMDDGREEIDWEKANPIWKPWYDKSHGFVVAAVNEEEARKLAAECASALGGSEIEDAGENPWLSTKHTICALLGVAVGKDFRKSVVLRDYRGA